MKTLIDRTCARYTEISHKEMYFTSRYRCKYPVHMIEHVMSSHHDIAHEAGLAVVIPPGVDALRCPSSPCSVEL